MRTLAARNAIGLLLLGTLCMEPVVLAQIAQPPTTPAATTNKELPWKPVASPQGVLALEDPTRFETFGDRAKFEDTKKVVEELLNATVRKLASPVLTKKDLVYAIHIVEFGDQVNTGDAGKQSADVKVKSNSWYLYHKNVSFDEFTGQRIFGSRNVVVLFLHVNAKGLLSNELKEQNCDALTRNSASVPCTAAEAKEKSTNSVFLGEGALIDASNGLKLRPLGDGAVVSSYADVQYEAAVVKKVAANVQNLLSILKLLGIVSEAAQLGLRRVVTDNVIVWGSGTITDMTVPSDVHIAGFGFAIDNPVPAGQRDSLRLGAEAALDNEGRYWWDASIGIPVHKIKDVQYSSSEGTVEAKQVDKQSAYAMFNVMAWPVDIKNPKSSLVPRLLLGFPLSSSPWDSLFVGGGVGIPKIMLGNQFFAGVVFNRVSKPQTLAAGAAASPAELANDSRLQTEKKLMIGINVPVKSVLDKLLKQ
jgi:hypothetical protein